MQSHASHLSNPCLACDQSSICFQLSGLSWTGLTNSVWRLRQSHFATENDARLWMMQPGLGANIERLKPICLFLDVCSAILENLQDTTKDHIKTLGQAPNKSPTQKGGLGMTGRTSMNLEDVSKSLTTCCQVIHHRTFDSVNFLSFSLKISIAFFGDTLFGNQRWEAIRAVFWIFQWH